MMTVSGLCLDANVANLLLGKAIVNAFITRIFCNQFFIEKLYDSSEWQQPVSYNHWI